MDGMHYHMHTLKWFFFFSLLARKLSELVKESLQYHIKFCYSYEYW